MWVVLDGAKARYTGVRDVFDAAALIFAGKGFRRVRGHDHMNQFIEALGSHQSALALLKKAA
jgi:hypothetical protein